MLKQLEKTRKSKTKYHLRPATMEDLTEVVALVNTCAIDQTGAPRSNENQLKSEWTGPGFDIEKSIRIAEAKNGQIIGYIEVWDTDPVPVASFVWARVDPQYEGMGVGTNLMNWAEKRLQQTITRVPEDLQVIYVCSSLNHHESTKHLLQSFGMKMERYYWRMAIDLQQEPPIPKWPEGITITSLAEYGDLHAVYRAFDDAFKDHFGYIQQPEDTGVTKWEHWISTDKEIDTKHWYLALDGSEIAAICLCRQREWEDPQMGWVNILGVRRPWRHNGLALALLQHAFGQFYRLGKQRAGLTVDAQSLTGATRLYTKAGMHVTREFQFYEKVLRAGRDIRRKELNR